jgi:hypothetical protein
MLLKDLIKKLQDLYDTYDENYKNENGEPEIMIDSFRLVDQKRMLCTYVGFDDNVEIVKSDDGVYNIISGFEPTPEEKKKSNMNEVWKYL